MYVVNTDGIVWVVFGSTENCVTKLGSQTPSKEVQGGV